MNKYFVVLACIFLVMFSSQNIMAQTTKYGDNVATLDGIMKAYYDVVTVKKGEKVSYERDSILHIASAQVGWNQQGKDGKPNLTMISLKDYHKMSDAYLEKNGFYEIEISRKVEKFGSVYHVWSTYETRNTSDGPIIGRGINSIELFFDGTRFWIITWLFDDERKDNPIPSEYLTK
ncbi:MAG TPA: hypothetical protein PKM63_16325 [Panacibacter sp.]|nr:hypothetical protein [Panacibacter sp.]HNP45860.1 hypothetical protein [Panacibacter sp.]